MFSLDQFRRFIPNICQDILQVATAVATVTDNAAADSSAEMSPVSASSPAPPQGPTSDDQPKTRPVRNQHFGKKLTYSRAYATCNGSL